MKLAIDVRLRAALIAILFVVAACAVAPTAINAPVNLVVWVDNPAIGASIRQRIIPFERDHPNIQIKVFDQLGKIRNGDVSTAIEALNDSELAPDVIALSDSDIALMSNPNDLMNLSPYIIQQSDFHLDDFFPTVLSDFQVRGRQLAIPSEIVPWVIFYNKQMFNTAKVSFPSLDWTTSEFVSDAQRVQRGTSAKQSTIGFVTDPTQAFLAFTETYGVQPQSGVDDPYAHWLDDPQTIAAMQWFADLGLRQRIMPTEIGNRSVGLWFAGRAAMTGMFMDQREQLPAYMQRNLSSLTPTVTASPVPPAGWKFPWGVTMVPKATVRSSIYYVSGYGISQTSHDPDNSWLLVDYLTGHLPEQTGHAYVPARESLAYSKAFAQLYPETGRQAYIQSIQEGQRIPAWPPGAQITQADLQNILLGTQHAANGLHAIRDRIQPVLATQVTPVPTPLGG